MELTQLGTLDAIVEAGSLNRAAERLGVSQSTLSRQIQALEADLGARVVERSAEGVALTGVGRVLLERSRPLLVQFEAVVEEARQLARGRTSSLRIGYLSSAVSDFVNPALEGLRSGFPSVRIRLLDLSPGEQVEALRSGAIDVGLVGHAGAFLAREFYTRRVAVLPVTVAMAATDPLAGKPKVALADLRGRLFVGAAEKDMPGHNRWVARLCAKAGFRPRFVTDAESMVHQLATTLAEGAVALLPDYLHRASVPGVIFKPLSDSRATCEIYVAWQRGKASAILKGFLSHLPAVPSRQVVS